ncbi:MAG: hypothetical protein AB7L65_07715, partial [Hyphomonadaceae bacterium]
TVLKLTQHVEAAETSAAETARQLATAIDRFRAAADTLNGKLAAREAEAAELRAGHEQLAAELAEKDSALRQEVSVLEARLSAGDGAVQALTENLQALQLGVESQIDDLSARTLDVIAAGLADAREAATAASAASGAAVAAALRDMRAMETTITARLDAGEASARTEIARLEREARAAHAQLHERLEAARGRSENALAALADNFQGAFDRLNSDLVARLEDLDAKTKSYLVSGLADAQSAADLAAGRCEAAAAAAVETFREYRATLNARLEESDAAQRAQVENAFEQARLSTQALAARVREDENINHTAHEKLAARIDEIARAASEDLEDNLRTQEAALAALTAEWARRGEDAAAVVETLRADFETVDAERRAGETDMQAHLRMIEAAIAPAPARFTEIENAHAALHARMAPLEDMLTAATEETHARISAVEHAVLPARLADAAAGFDAKLEAAARQAQAQVADLAATVQALRGETGERIGEAVAAAVARFEARLGALAARFEALAEEGRAEAARSLAEAQARGNEAGAAHAATIAAQVEALENAAIAREAALRAELMAAGAESTEQAQEAAAALAERLDEADRREAAALSRLGLEILSAHEGAAERMGEIEKRCLEAIQSVGALLGQMDEKLHKQQDQFSRGLAERLIQLETVLTESRAGARRQA